jgi:hypothetical protein
MEGIGIFDLRFAICDLRFTRVEDRSLTSRKNPALTV